MAGSSWFTRLLFRDGSLGKFAACAGVCIAVPSFSHEESRQVFAGLLAKLSRLAATVSMPMVVMSQHAPHEWIPELGDLPWRSCQSHLCQWRKGESRVLRLHGLYVDVAPLAVECHGCPSCLLRLPHGRIRSASLPSTF
eukprot:4892468-Amphidinium_carterae.1